MSEEIINPAYSPEKAGLELLVNIDIGEAYSPHEVYLFRRIADGALFWDSGWACSCYDPMEDCRIETLKALPQTASELLDECGNDKDAEPLLIAAGLIIDGGARS